MYLTTKRTVAPVTTVDIDSVPVTKMHGNTTEGIEVDHLSMSDGQAKASDCENFQDHLRNVL